VEWTALLDKEELYLEINGTIRKFEQLLEEYDPLSIISIVARDPYNPLFLLIPDGYSEPLLEYLMSLALAKPYPKTTKQPTKTLREELYKLWKNLTFAVPMYFGLDISEIQSDTELRFNLILQYLQIRGDAYIQHLNLTFLDLFKSHSQHLQKEIGFSAEDLQGFVNRLEVAITSALKKQMETSIGAHSNYEIFEIRPENKIEALILRELSCTFGDNQGFLDEAPKWSAWPTNDTIITSHPIIKHNERYFAFHLPMTVRGCKSYIETLLKQKSEKYYMEKYLPSRDKYLEHTTMDLINTLLPKAKVHRNLLYDVVDNGLKKQYELDGLVVYDDCLIIIETKARELRIPSKRGHIVKLKGDLKKILQEAHKQATRAIGYINSALEVSFFDKRNSRRVEISRRNYKHVFIILGNFEPLYVLSTHLSTAKRLGLLSGEEWPWFVYLNDLRVISEIIEHPSTFLHYIQKRIALNDMSSLKAFDELDYFMYYLKKGLPLNKEEIESHDMTMIGVFTEELDLYYSLLGRKISDITKPSIEMHETFELLLTQLEIRQPRHFISSCFHLLDANYEKRASIGKLVEICEERAKKFGNSKIVKFRIGKVGFILSCIKNIENHERKIIEAGNRYINSKNLDKAFAIYWSPPLISGNLKTISISGK
jgi:hypothetical protein